MYFYEQLVGISSYTPFCDGCFEVTKQGHATRGRCLMQLPLPPSPSAVGDVEGATLSCQEHLSAI